MIRQQWTAMLAKLTAPMSAPVAAKALADMLPMLEDYPDAAFSLASLEHVASRCERVPTYAELRTALGEWWRENRPPERALPAPGQRNVEEEDRQFWNDMTDAELRERVAKIEADNRPPAGSQAALKRTTVSGLKRHAPHRLAMLPPVWLANAGDPTTPAEAAAALFPGLTGDEAARRSRFGLSPAVAPSRSPSDQADTVTQPKAPGALSPEVLAVLRAQLRAVNDR
jgi:hypothetical protein